MPVRPFGNTGINVSILSFGGSLDTSLSMLVLRQAFKWGVTYWDTANTYMGGRSEKGIGKYLEKFPRDRQHIFLVTKSHAWTLKGLSRDLDLSLERMRTDYIDLYFLHSVRKIGQLDDGIKSWAEKKKAEGKIRMFGFSTHGNMEECMLGASKLGWIDGIMMRYNYRLMHSDDMRRAVDACTKAGIGLTAMKTQGGGQVKTNSETELKLAGRFMDKGFTGAVYRCPGQTQGCLGKPEHCLYLFGDAQYDDFDGQPGRSDGQNQTFFPGKRVIAAVCAGNAIDLLRRMYRHLRISSCRQYPHR